MSNNCKNCSKFNACAKRPSNEIIVKFYADFESDEDVFTAKEDIKCYLDLFNGCVGFYTPFLEESIKSMIVVMKYSSLYQVWISDVRRPGPKDVFYQIPI